MNIKICGLKNLSDAEYCCHLNAWALGFNFYTKSTRYISDTAALELIKALPSSVLKVGIFIGASYQQLAQQMEVLGLDLVQVYTPLQDAPASFKDKVILSLQAATQKDLPPASILSAYRYILLDAPKSKNDLPGGTGRLANWALAGQLAKEYQLILAGGLTADNAKEAIETVNPYALDLASGIEQAPGIKDKSKLNRLFEECSNDN